MRIMEDTKTDKTSRIAAAKADPTARSLTDAKRKLHIHVTCIIIAGIVSTILFQLKVGNAMTLGFGPVTPSLVQEIFDRMFRL